MAGIVSYGTYIPTYRLPRDLIAKEWGTPSLGGERAVANFDEDSLTLAVNASIDAFGSREPQTLAGVFFASTTSPYREKQAAATIATVLDASPEVRTMDFTDTLRAGTSALLTALDLVQSGKHILVCAGDSRMGEPDSQQEQNYGDAGGAMLVGTGNVLAEVVGTYTISQDFLGTWRTEEQDYLRSFPGGFETRFGYNRFIAAAVQGILKKCNLTTKEIANAAIAAPSQRTLQAALRGLGLDVKTQVQDTFWNTVGDAGTAQPLVLLAAVLERAKPGDLILVAGYGDGGDAEISLGQLRSELWVVAALVEEVLVVFQGRFQELLRLFPTEAWLANRNPSKPLPPSSQELTDCTLYAMQFIADVYYLHKGGYISKSVGGFGKGKSEKP